MNKRSRTIPGDRYCSVCGRMVSSAHMLRSGRPRCERTARQFRFWTPVRLWRLAELTERGLSSRQIADALSQEWGRPLTGRAVEQARINAGLIPPTRTALTMGEVVRLLGASDPAVMRWIAKGWLPATQGPVQGWHRTWRVSRDALWAFVADPRTWHLWEVTGVTDPMLRAHVAAVRGEPVHATATEAVTVLERRGLYVTRATVDRWLRDGHLPHVTLPVRRSSGRSGMTGKETVKLIPRSRLATIEPPPLGARIPRIPAVGRSGERGITASHRGWRVMIGGRYLGCRATVPEAVALRDGVVRTQDGSVTPMGERRAA